MTFAAHGRTADARSVVAIMALGVRHGDELQIHASGSSAAQAIVAIEAGLEEAKRSEAVHESAAAALQPASGLPPRVPAAVGAAPAAPHAILEGELTGISAVRGFAVGRAARIERRDIEVSEQGAGIAHERAELDRALANVRLRLQRVRDTGGAERREIIEAHLEFLDDPGLLLSVSERMAAGKSAGFAWREATRRSMAELQALDDSRLRERADDLLDVEAHVLLALAGEARPMHLPLPEQAVLLADDLLPSELTALDRLDWLRLP